MPQFFMPFQGLLASHHAAGMKIGCNRLPRANDYASSNRSRVAGRQATAHLLRPGGSVAREEWKELGRLEGGGADSLQATDRILKPALCGWQTGGCMGAGD